MPGFTESFIDRLIARLRHFLFGGSDRQFAEQYAEAAAGRFVTPDPSADAMGPMLEINEFMTYIMLSVFGIYLAWLITKAGLGMLQGSNAIFKGAKILVGLGLLVMNVELIFAIFQLSTELVEAVYYLQALEQVDGVPGESLIGPLGVTGAVITAGTAMLFKILSGTVLFVTLQLRWVALYLIVGFAPVVIVTWMMGSPVGLGASIRAIFFVVPLVLGLYVIEIINPGAQIALGFFESSVNSLLIFGVIWMSVKISAVGKLATGGLKAAAGTAALGATAAALGGTSMVAKAGIAKSFGVGGIPLSRALGGGAEGQGGAGGYGRDDPREYTATGRGGEGDPPAKVVDDSGRSQDEIWGKSWAEGVTPTTEKYADNSRWKSDTDLLQQMEPNQPDKGVWRSVHEEGGAPDDLSPGQVSRRGGGSMRGIEEGKFRTEEEHKEFWGEHGNDPTSTEGVQEERNSGPFQWL